MVLAFLASDLPFVPPQASSAAGHVDLLLLAITLVAVFFSVGIGLTVLCFVARYRKGRDVDRHQRPINHLPIEITWTVIPALIGIGIFGWGGFLYLQDEKVPANSMPIYVVGKQWMWKIQYPDGRAEIDGLHVPLGRPIVLILTSEDVVHSFFVPAFRLKQDAIPGQYTRLPFTATKAGTYHLFCSEFCGTYHSNMTGLVTVMPPASYEQWLRDGDRSPTIAAQGEQFFRQFGCSGCHMGGSVRAPRLEGIYGNPVAVQVPRPGVPLTQVAATTITADERYLHDSIVLPEKEIAAGYPAIMPTYRNRITEAQIFAIIAYLRSLDPGPGTTERREGTRTWLGPDEYRARTGFVPPNAPPPPGGAALRGTNTSNTPGPRPAHPRGSGTQQDGAK